MSECSQGCPKRPKNLPRIGLFSEAVNDAGLTSYSQKGLADAELVDLLVRAIAIGDDPPVEGMVQQIAAEIDAVCDLVAPHDGAIGKLLHTWATRLRITVEVMRREKAVPCDG